MTNKFEVFIDKLASNEAIIEGRILRIGFCGSFIIAHSNSSNFYYTFLYFN